MVLIRHNSFLELSFGFICCCLITFPAFLEHHGTTVMSWLRSRTNSSRGSNSRGTASPHSEKRRQSPKTDENDKHSFNSFNSADARLTFATAPAGLVQSADLETGELHDLSGSSSRSRLEHVDLWTLLLHFAIIYYILMLSPYRGSLGKRNWCFWLTKFRLYYAKTSKALVYFYECDLVQSPVYTMMKHVRNNNDSCLVTVHIGPATSRVIQHM